MVSITMFVAVLYRRITVAKSALPDIPHQMADPGGRRSRPLTGIEKPRAGTVAVVRAPDGNPPGKAPRQGRHKQGPPVAASSGGPCYLALLPRITDYLRS